MSSRISATPNILFILSDQQRWDSLGAYGQRLQVSPHLDRLANDGTLFQNAFTCQPVCGPARACLQTGEYATRNGCFVNGIHLPEGRPTLAREMSSLGYSVGYVGKWHLASSTAHEFHHEPVPIERRGGYDGFWRATDMPEFQSNSYAGSLYDEDMQEHFFKNVYRADAYTDHALEFIERHHGERPFFLFLSLVEPHPQPCHRHYQGPPLTHPAKVLRDYLRYEGPLEMREQFGDYDVPGDIPKDAGDFSEAYADYLASCARIDWNVGRLIDALKRKHFFENTCLFYSSDHGCHFHTRNRSDGKHSCHDSSIRVPLIVHGPGFSGGQRPDSLVSLIDLPPTLVQCGQGQPPAYMQGRPLQDLWSDDAQPSWAEDVLVQTSGVELGRAIRTRDWKYGVVAPNKNPNKDVASDVYEERYLYDLKKDPHERNNLAGVPDLDEVREVLKARLIRRMVDAGEGAPCIVSNLESQK